MSSRVVREDGLGRQHLQEATEPAQERAVARLAIFMGLRATELGQQLHFGPIEADPQVKQEACSDPGQSH